MVAVSYSVFVALSSVSTLGRRLPCRASCTSCTSCTSCAWSSAREVAEWTHVRSCGGSCVLIRVRLRFSHGV